MSETLQWDAFAARLRTVGFLNPHVIINGHRAELETLNDVLRYFAPRAWRRMPRRLRRSRRP